MFNHQVLVYSCPCLMSNTVKSKFSSLSTKTKHLQYTYLKAKPVLLLPEAKMGHFFVPEFVRFHHTHKRDLSWDHILKEKNITVHTPTEPIGLKNSLISEQTLIRVTFPTALKWREGLEIKVLHSIFKSRLKQNDKCQQGSF